MESVPRYCDHFLRFDPDSCKVSNHLLLHVAFVEFHGVQRNRRAEHCLPAAEMPPKIKLLGARRYLTCFEKSIY